MPLVPREIIELYRKLGKYQQGGSLINNDDILFEEYYKTLPENLKDTTSYRVRDYWIFNNKPKNFKQAKKLGMFKYNKKDKLYHANSVLENPETEEIEFMKRFDHPTILLELDWYNSKEGEDFRNNWELVESKPYYKYIRRKKGGTLTLKKSTDDLIEEALEWIPQITIIEEIVEEPKKESKKLSEKELMKLLIKEAIIELITK